MGWLEVGQSAVSDLDDAERQYGSQEYAEQRAGRDAHAALHRPSHSPTMANAAATRCRQHG